MNFNDHSNLKDLHAFLSPSKYHWIRYSDEKLLDKLKTHRATEEGVIKHAYAEQAIRLGRKQGGPNDAIKLHINDAIGFRMTPEVVLSYSPWCFGTADAIGFNSRKSKLRIHDLKTGTTVASMDQLMVYTAIFCLEYDVKPSEIETELRIYQGVEPIIHIPGVPEIVPIMDKIVWFDKLIDSTFER